MKYKASIIEDLELRRIQPNHKFNYNIENYYCRRFKDMKVCHYLSDYDRRVTEIAIHPFKNVAVSGSKGGTMTLHNIRGKIREVFTWEGRGPGNSILDITFPCNVDNKMLTASLDGTIKLWDLERLSDKPCYINDKYCLLDTNDFSKWYCSVAQCPSNFLTIAGCNKGYITLLDKDFKKIESLKVHKNKVNSLHFNGNNTNLLVSASVDRTAKIFDIRNLNSCIETIHHSSPFNNAVFSRSNGCRLLLTDQRSDIKVYKGPLWTSERTIKHPHRQFQHLTPIRASWHPHLDLIVIGRYPDKNLEGFRSDDLKTIDVFSAETGDLKAEIFSSAVRPIITSISKFNSNGDVLVTGTGSLVMFWTFPDPKNLEVNNNDNHKEETETPVKNVKRRKKQ